MPVLIGKKAPSFKEKAVVNGGDVVTDFSLDQYLGKNHVLFFFYPKDFSLVCPTELYAFQERIEDFKSRGCQLVACSTDTPESHCSWLQLEKTAGGIKGITYPIVADTSKCIAANYGVLAGDYDLDDEGCLISTEAMIAYRGLFLLDKEGTVWHQIVNNFPLIRSVDEALRMVDALQFHENNGEVCPANWPKSEDALHDTFERIADDLATN